METNQAAHIVYDGSLGEIVPILPETRFGPADLTMVILAAIALVWQVLFLSKFNHMKTGR